MPGITRSQRSLRAGVLGHRAYVAQATMLGMLRVSLRRVKADHLDELREWLKTVNGPRRAEAIATLADEGCRHEQAYLLSDSEGPLLLYVMEVEDVERSRQVVRTSSHPIDADHLQVITQTVGDSIETELVLDLAAEA